MAPYISSQVIGLFCSTKDSWVLLHRVYVLIKHSSRLCPEVHSAVWSDTGIVIVHTDTHMQRHGEVCLFLRLIKKPALGVKGPSFYLWLVVFCLLMLQYNTTQHVISKVIQHCYSFTLQGMLPNPTFISNCPCGKTISRICVMGGKKAGQGWVFSMKHSPPVGLKDGCKMFTGCSIVESGGCGQVGFMVVTLDPHS